jgi:hypothetical protein
VSRKEWLFHSFCIFLKLIKIKKYMKNKKMFDILLFVWYDMVKFKYGSEEICQEKDQN